MARGGCALGWRPDRDDEFAGPQHGLLVRRVAGESMQRLEGDFSEPVGTFHLHHRVQGHQRHAEVRRVGGDAGLAPAEDGVQPGLPQPRVAA